MKKFLSPLLALLLSCAVVHAQMVPGISGSMFFSGKPCTGNDQYTKILLHMNGANGGTSFPDTNAGGSAHTWTASAATTDTGTYKFPTASMNSVGGSKYITTSDNADFTLGSGNFTVDYWFSVSGGAGTNRAASGQSNSVGSSFSYYSRLNSSNVVECGILIGGITYTAIGTTAITTPGLHHYACVRNGNLLSVYLDGTREGTNSSFTGSITDSGNNFSVGRLGEVTAVTWNGYIDEFRLSVGIARWTGTTFPVPTQPYCPN